jgi:replicative DNA helicase
MNTRQLHDHALEESWMGALLHSPELIPQVLTTSENIDFIDRVDLSAGWSAMADMYQKGIAIDPVSLGTYLKTNGLLTERDVDEMISTSPSWAATRTTLKAGPISSPPSDAFGTRTRSGETSSG